MKYRISIPEPCHENWHKMTPQEQGRFCDKCQKCVVDFTGLSTQQMFQHIYSGKELCGRFRPDQLDRVFTETPVKKSRSFQYLFTSALAFLGANKVFGQSENPQDVGKIAPIEMEHASAVPVVQDSIKSEGNFIIFGTILDSATGSAIPFASVYCMALDVGVSADVNGNYSFIIDKNKLRDSTLMQVSFLGYNEVNVHIDVANQPQNIFLNDSGEIIDEVQVLGGVCVEKPTFWQKIGNWFRRVF